MKLMKTIMKLILILIGSVLLGTAFLYLVFLLPTDGMSRHAKDAVTAFSIERNYPMMDGTEATQLDNWTDSLMLLNALFEKEGTRTLEQVLDVYQPGYESGNPTESFILYEDGTKPLYTTSYSRYWHGYLVILKPLLTVMGYLGIRGLNRILQTLLMLATAVILWRRHGLRPILPLAAAYGFLRPGAVAFSMQFSTVFYPSMIAVLIMALFYDQVNKGNRFLYLFLLVGIITNYLDFLTYPIAGLGIPMGMWLCLSRGKSWQYQAKQVILGSMCWGFGYFGMWIGKWVIGSILLHKSIIADALTQAQFRSSSTVGDITVSRGLVILRNLYTGTGGRLWLFLLVPVIMLAMGLWQSKWNWKKLALQIIPYLLVAAMPFVWYAVMLNHSFVHHWFTYRGLAASVFAVVGIGVMCGDTERIV